MALTPNFSASQAIGLADEIILTDTSTGSDVAITQRRVYIQNSEGDYLVESGTTTDYEVWAYADSSITLDVLTEDTACNITVRWLDVSNAVLYSKTTLFAFTMNTETFYYSLTQAQTSSPNIINDTFYYGNKTALRSEIDSANNAVEYGSDIYAAQAALDRATTLVNGQNEYF